ncbi:glycosyl hydrolase family 8, partial [Caenispirillum bisanense]
MDITRRRFVLTSMTMLAAPKHAWSGEPCADWDLWKRMFLLPDGRVVDTDNGGITHSEGQAYGMILATAFDDQATFELVWRWTRQTLRREDALFAWKYLSTATSGAVAEWNNAADADLMIAWALLRAAERWARHDLAEEAKTVASAIARLLIVEEPFGLVLRPGLSGFQFPDRRIA